MANFKMPVRVATLVAMGFLSLSAYAQDCITPTASDFYVDKDDASSSDTANGHYTRDGGTGPFKTIQHLVDVIKPGQCGFVRKSSTAYYENTFRSGDFGGVTFTAGGTSDTNRVIVAGYPGEQPVIDQRRAAPANGGSSVTGFYVYKGSFITIRNFEVINTVGPGISTNPSSVTDHINIESNNVHNMAGTGNPNNVGGIRIDYCHFCNIRDNVIHDVGDDRGADGINAFRPGGCVLENNLIYNVAIAVQLKQADDNSMDAHIVRNNIIANASVAAYKMQVQGDANLAAPHNTSFYNNLVYNVQNGVWADLQEAGQQATSLKIYNNTFIKTMNIAWIGNFSGMEVYNNVYDHWSSQWASSMSGTSIFTTFYERNYPERWVNQLNYFDNNLYFDVNPKWDFDVYTSHETVYTSLVSWLLAAVKIGIAPDIKAKFADPSFVTSSPDINKLLRGDVSDFALNPSSPGLTMGRNADTVGAVRGGVVVGPRTTIISSHVPTAPATTVL